MESQDPPLTLHGEREGQAVDGFARDPLSGGARLVKITRGDNIGYSAFSPLCQVT